MARIKRFLVVVIVMISSVGAAFISSLSRCPSPCQSSIIGSPGWTYYHDFNIFQSCDRTVFFETNLYNAFNKTNNHISFRACTAHTAASTAPDFIQIVSRRRIADDSRPLKSSVPLDALSWGPATSTSDAPSVTSALADVRDFLTGNSSISTLFAGRGNTVIGFYAGPGIDLTSVGDAVDAFTRAGGPFRARRVVQWCGPPSGDANRQSFGLILDTNGDLSGVQSAMAHWASGTCLEGSHDDNSWWSAGSVSISTTLNSSDTAVKARGLVSGRATCNYIQAQSGDGCWALTQRCGITESQLESYNGGANFCNNIVIGQYVCCSSGSLPDFSPQPTNGNCYAYTVKAQDTCAAIAEAHQMTVSGIENNNNQTWGWMGCSDLQIGQMICLSTGQPPFPVNIPNAVCGPQVNGTIPTSDPLTWSDLNPCPLNACCDIWGQCGITSDFCTSDPAETGAPGTAKPGSNGCISNCGTDIKISEAPDSFARVGYFEAWNTDRSCLNMWPQSIPAYYTHVHFAFANITSDFEVDVSAVDDMFKQFKAKTGFNHILSFGGWAFSTSPETYPIFRQGVTEAQRQSFANNIATFIIENGMDGVDFDWEYPGAPDIPGIPPGSPEDGANYLDFLKKMRAALPEQFSISIAAPASYWYLRGFPIANISDVVDYIIYMTYDLHGQWDYGNSFSDPGCPEGSCLRSHINRTETEQAFSMITKAGVPSRKIMVGLPLYGRSFQMAQAGCYTEMCKFTGPDSGATKGKCTDTAGYISNWEIQQILETPGNDAQQYFSSVAGDILVYDGTQYISYMTTATYDSRLQWAQSLNFGGVSDWAMDLETSYYGNGTEVGTGSGVVYIDPEIFAEPDPTIFCEPPCTFVLPPWTLPEPTVISRPPITETVLNMYMSIQTLTNGVTSTVYVSVTTVTTITLPPLTTDKIELWNVGWSDVEETIIYFTSSVVFPPAILTQSPDVVTSATQTTTLAGYIYTYNPGPYPDQSPSTTNGPPPGPPPPNSKGSVHVASGTASPTCVSGCGHSCKFNCKPELPCIFICGCIGLGCPGGGSCIGPRCGSDSGSGSDDDSDPSCSRTNTVTDCQVDCSITDFGTTVTTTCYSTTCVTVEACSTKGFTTTSETTTFACPWTTALASAVWQPTDPDALPPLLGGGGEFGYVYITAANLPAPSPSLTNFIDCNFHGQDPDQGVVDQYCVCSGSTFPASSNTLYPGQSCAYTELPTKTTSISTIKEVVTAGCEVCTYAGLNADCSTINGCVAATTTTVPVTVTVTPTADCASWGTDAFLIFEIYNIRYWATDGGNRLKSEEKGCGLLTGWDWHSATSEYFPHVYFNLPYFIKAGCVERAIKSAGGPAIQCQRQDGDGPARKRDDQIEGREIHEADNGDNRIRETASYRLPSPMPTYTYPASLTSRPLYVPMVWTGSAALPVVITTTLLAEAVTILTTTVPITATSPVLPLPTQAPR